MELLISLVSGVAGGNLLGGLLKDLNQGVLINSLAGLFGGGLGGQSLGLLGTPHLGDSYGAILGLEAGIFLGHVAAGGIGGGILMVVVGVIRNAQSK